MKTTIAEPAHLIAPLVMAVILALEMGGLTSYNEVISWLKDCTASILAMQVSKAQGLYVLCMYTNPK